jgi:adenylyltransferase/sulfurtransferase
VTESEIDVAEVKAKLDRGDHFVPIDVREPHEYKICHIPAAKLIPLGEVPKRLSELDANADIVIHCRSGVRSDKVERSVPKYRSIGGG